MMKNFITLLVVIGLSQFIFSQSSIMIGGGYEVNTIKKPLDLYDSGEFVIPANPPLSSWTLSMAVRKDITNTSVLSLSAIYSQLRDIGFILNGIAPTKHFGYRRFSLRPEYVYQYNAISASIGADISILFDHFQGVDGVSRSNDNAKRPELFNIQFGPTASIGYEWKRFMVQANTSIGLFYRERYFNYINTFSTFGVTLFYEAFSSTK